MNQRSMTGTFALLATMAGVAIVGLAGCGGSTQHLSFATAEDAVTAMIAAVQSGDQVQLKAVFGPGSDGVISSGDPVADANDRKSFLARYEAKHALVPEGDDRMTLQVGVADWPLPVPVVKRDGKWVLDGADGADEIAYRRVGGNELGAIAVCRGYVDAQVEYASVGRDGLPAGIYAQKVMSDEGAQNGLYWKVAEGEPESPVGPWVAAAAAEGYRASTSKAYRGYRYRQLYAQGANAEGGAVDYFVNGYLARGFALIAWPAEYGVSGVQTFIVSQAGAVYQKDLGEETDSAVEAIETFDPDATWTLVAEEETVAAE